MIATLTALMGNIWVRRACLAVLVLLALLAVRQHYINLGKDRGVSQESQKSAEANASAVHDDHATTTTQLSALTNDLANLHKQLDAQNQIILALATQRQQAAQQVQGMTPQQVEDAIARALGKQSASQPETPEQRKEIASCLAEYPICKKQVDADAVVSADSRKEAAKQEVRYNVLAGYATRLETNYTTLWNDKSQKKRAWKCLKLWNCARPQIKAPDPKDLLQRPEVK